MTRTVQGGEPFFMQGNATGCLLIHGFTGAPNEMRLLGEHLAACGFSVLGIRLAGHGTSMEDLIRTREQDWIASVEDGFQLLQACCDHVIALGLSMGGVLTLHAAANLPVTGAIAMSAPYLVPHPFIATLRPILPLVSRLWPYHTKRHPGLEKVESQHEHVEYEAYPYRAVAELEDLIRLMKADLSAIRIPVLLMHSRADETVPEAHAERLLASLGTEDKHLLWLEESGHVITHDVEQDIVFDAAVKFIRRVTEEN